MPFLGSSKKQLFKNPTVFYYSPEKIKNGAAEI